MPTFDVYDKKNPERLLGSLKASPHRYSPTFEMASIPEMPRCYLGDLQAAIRVGYERIQFDIEWRGMNNEIDTGSPWYKQRTHSSWAVLLTDAPLDLLLKYREFTPAGSVRLDRRTFGLL